ncbi:hypothetical protein [Emticicia sp. 17c]|uniref:hypothetical protein n=1 Tax=Emticicia sp. 17c TaxID=3127704 RepID=UPI00301C3123
MKALQVFIFDGGRTGYVLLEDGTMLTFYNYTLKTVKQSSQLDISFRQTVDPKLKSLAKSKLFDYLKTGARGEQTYELTGKTGLPQEETASIVEETEIDNA